MARFASTLKTPLPGAKPRHQPHVTLRLSTARQGGAIEIEVQGAAVRWRTGDTWENGEVADVFEPLFLLSLAYLANEHRPDTYVVASAFVANSNWAFRFDESLGVFESIVAGDDGRGSRAGCAPSVAVEQGVDGMRDLTFFPLAYQPHLPPSGPSSTEVRIAPGCSLVKFPELTGMISMSMSLAVERSRTEDGHTTWGLGRAEFLFGIARGVAFNHNALSYGQKRLLSFLYYLDVNAACVVADELVNGMHHDWIRASLDEIGDRQAFLTSQNPLLLDYLPLESVEQVQKTFIQCRTETKGDEPQASWSNLSAEDAAELFADYEVGIQPVGEILRARGLW
jgi:hypothetical protein